MGAPASPGRSSAASTLGHHATPAGTRSPRARLPSPARPAALGVTPNAFRGQAGSVPPNRASLRKQRSKNSAAFRGQREETSDTGQLRIKDHWRQIFYLSFFFSLFFIPFFFFMQRFPPHRALGVPVNPWAGSSSSHRHAPGFSLIESLFIVKGGFVATFFWFQLHISGS